jgi:hypothetical protein
MNSCWLEKQVEEASADYTHAYRTFLPANRLEIRMNHRPLIVIFLGMLCLYAALIPMGGLDSQPARLPDSLFSPWLITELEIEQGSQFLPVARQPLNSNPTAGVLVPASSNAESSQLTPAGAAPRKYPPSPNARPPVWNPIGG